MQIFRRSFLFTTAWALVVTLAGALPAAARTQGAPQAASTAPVLVTAAQWRRMAAEAEKSPMFAREVSQLEAFVQKAMKAGIHVPVPKGAGGSYTDEQHAYNARVLKAAGTLYRLTGDRKYVRFARDMLLQYAKLYPTLGRNPAGHGPDAGRLFWRVLNDSVWLVYSIQGYDAIRDALDAQDRRKIDAMFLDMAHFLSDGTPHNFDRINNHATWAACGVGMTGFVLRDPTLVKKALYGLHEDGKAGFLRQVAMLFSPDGYYREGPYYARYAIVPFMIFANVLQNNLPQLKIFQYHDGALGKAVYALAQQTYDGFLFPLDDSLPKSMKSPDLVLAVDTTYARNHDARLLSIARIKGRVTTTLGGLDVSEGLAQGKAKPFPYRSVLLRDGPNGHQGALAIMRFGNNRTGQTLVMKDTAMGMGHGHFDKLSWIFYDAGHAIVTDYGSARFLNIEVKDGGRYLPENKAWAKQTIAHNTLVVNETSDYAGNWRRGAKLPPKQLLFAVTRDTRISSARMVGALRNVTFTRTLALMKDPSLEYPIVVDLLRVHGTKPATYDLPLQFAGAILDVGFKAHHFTTDRPVLGTKNGYQYLWVDARSPAEKSQRTLEWLNGDRFYTYRFAASAPTRAILAQLGANDPNFNLRRQEMLIERLQGQKDATFYAVLEPHGMFNPTEGSTRGQNSQIRDMKLLQGKDAEVVVLTLDNGKTLALAVADDPANATRPHHVAADGYDYRWTGGWARFEGRHGDHSAQVVHETGKAQP